MQSSNLDLLQRILAFLKHPTSEGAEQQSVLFVFKQLLTLISWLYVLVFPVAIAITLLLKLLNYDGVNAVNELAMNGEFWEVLFLGVVLAPLIEEITFRLPLRYHRAYLLLSSFMVIRIIVVFFLRQSFPNLAQTSLMAGVIPLVLTTGVYFLLRLERVEKRVINFYTNRFPLLFYTATILFGLMHITNYSNVQNIVLIVLLLCIPQLIVGSILGFIRIRYGFAYALLMHAIYNGILLVPSSLVKAPTTPQSAQVAGIFGLLILCFLGYGIVTLGSASYKLMALKKVS
ncbi:MAG: CPBP family glutamic-type intramembrane protease [bacterium]|nr:CPBP family glutamic-type intramembrane protease [bacterium]